MGVADTESCQEVHEEWTVEVLAELAEYKPVTKGTVADVVLNLDNFDRPFEVSVHPHVDQAEPRRREPGLNDAVDEAESPDDGEEEKPPPEDQEHLVIDHVQSQHTDGVDVFLAATGAPPPVVTRSYPGESVTHGVLLLPLLLLRSPTSSSHTKLSWGKCHTWGSCA